MSALRQIRLQGGPDARAMQVIDMETGLPLAGVVKVELLCVPNDGALVNVTLACRLDSIDLVATDVGQPLIDLPDDHPEVSAADIARDMVEGLQAIHTAVGEQLLHVPTHFTGLTPAKVEPKLTVLPPVQPRQRRTLEARAHEMIAEPAPLPATLPAAPSEKARRAPRPEPQEEPAPEPDLSEAEKEELRTRLAKQSPWPFPPSGRGD